METIRCLIADIPQMILADIVQRLTQENGNIEMVERVSGIEDVPAILSSQAIDVLILGMKSNYVSQAYRDILNNFSDLVIVGLVDDGRQIAIYMNNVGCNEIVQVIRTFGKLSRE